MQSRMDKYNYNTDTPIKSRTQKNQDLYEVVRNSSMSDFDVNSNVSVLDDNSSIINVGRVKKLLDNKYNDTEHRRKSIELPIYEEDVVEEIVYDTKEYDINEILSKAKQGKNIDYDKERLRRVREAQYEILNNLDLELKNIEEPSKKYNRKEEENLMELINTITHIEQINKEKYSKEVSGAMDLLGFSETTESTAVTNLKEDINSEAEDEDEEDVIRLEETQEYEEDPIEETLNKLDININDYEDFKDISKQDKGALFIKIIIFVIIICLIVGGIYILDHLLNLGLF